MNTIQRSLARKLIKEYNEWRLEVNKIKTKYMRVGGKLKNLNPEDGPTNAECEEYQYLGAKLTDNSR